MKCIPIFCCLLLTIAGCKKKTCGTDAPTLKATRMAGTTDSIRYNLYYISGSCYIYKGLQERDSANVHMISVPEAKTDCECVGTALQRHVAYAFKTPAPGAYYYKWNNTSDRIDTVIIP
ncbi:hypothetical protein [Chitinophaga varians]|uniref:hypothetical protein n=1 Tax=Chitinophaga varians TaxID=2202339 RepID=UPI00165EFE2E|nr:hypothetical protein [Chitinophaga varians]MBC9914100.1 hypothetical protein [Chitinophaga varians]